MSDRSTEVFHKTHEFSQKFDYFVCGVSGALFAYVGEHYLPRKLHFGVLLLEPLSLVLFASSFFVGLKRLEWIIQASNLNAQLLDAGEKAGRMTAALASGPGPYINKEGGEISDRETVEANRQVYLEGRRLVETELEKVQARVRRLYKVRDWLLLLGFIMLLLAKLLDPYFR